MDTAVMRKNNTFSSFIEIDKEKVRTEIEKNGFYEEDGVKIKHWEGDKDTEYYVGTLKSGVNSYTGVLNVVCRRDYFGINHFDNGDVYFGMFDSDAKNKHGAYFFSPMIQNGYIHSEMYHGFWRSNVKETRGIYIWLKEKYTNETFDTSDFDAYVGEVESDSYKRGCYLTKVGDSYFVYYGNFDKDGHKSDDHGYFYDNVKDRVFCGKVQNDKFVKGHMVQFDDNSKPKTFVYVEFDNNETPVKFLRTEEMEESEKSIIIEKVNTFRDFLLGEDYFGMIYNHFKKVKNYSYNEMKDFKVIDSEDDYPKLMMMGSSYNDIKVYSNLEKLLKA